MLKGLPPLMTPGLLHVLASMGHGDVLAVVDRNYPAHSVHERLVELPGNDVTTVVAAVAGLLPIDDFISPAVLGMAPDGDPRFTSPAHDEVRAALEAAEGTPVTYATLERTAFYERARAAYAAIATSDDRPYACFLITKGVVRSP